MQRTVIPLAVSLLAAAACSTSVPGHEQQAARDVFHGIWYGNQPSGDVYGYKYAGGFATYPQQHVPIAYYSKAAGKTFFTYGGVSKDGSLLHMVSYYDHRTHELHEPVTLLDKKTGDAHDNPTLMLDDDGYVWVFSNSHGRARPAYIHRSRAPYSIDSFELVLKTNFSYSQPWFVPGLGWCFLHTRYGGGRRLYCWRSKDGRTWQKPLLLARIEKGHYQVSWRHGQKVGTAFNFHPEPVGLNARANLYYMETNDAGKTWTTADGTPVKLPLTTRANPALVLDTIATKELVYLKEVQFTAEGRPVILFLTSKGYRAGPENGPRRWFTIRWTGSEWIKRPFTTSDHNYDFGSLYIESDGTWRIIAPTDPGPQPWGQGGEIVVWTSRDQGATWVRGVNLTHDSARNHGYVRHPVFAHPDFYALWADGDARAKSASSLFYCRRDGTTAIRMVAGR